MVEVGVGRGLGLGLGLGGFGAGRATTARGHRCRRAGKRGRHRSRIAEALAALRVVLKSTREGTIARLC